MPRLRNVVWLVEDDHGEDDLRNDDSDARRGGDPRINVGDSAGVALPWVSTTSSARCKWRISIQAERTRIRDGLAGVNIEVQ